MANSLNMNLDDGARVVMKGPGDEASRTVTVKGGFGAKSFLSGTALFVERNGQSMRMDGMEMEKLANDREIKT